MTAPLRLVDANGEVHEVDRRYTDLEEQIIGLKKTIASQARMIGALERKLTQDDAEHHPQRAEITALIERWKRALGHPKAKASKDRFDLIRGRLKDGYELGHIALAIDGLGCFPYVRNGQRVRGGSPAERHDRLGICLGGGEQLEKFAILGHQARKQGLVTWEEA